MKKTIFNTNNFHRFCRRNAVALIFMLLASATSRPELAAQCQLARHDINPCTASFIVTRNDEEIGWLRVSRKINGASEILTTESQLEVQILATFKAWAKAENTFQNNILQRATLHRTLNGRPKAEHYLVSTPGKYQVIKNGKNLTLPEKIVKTVTCLYFQEPIGITQVFSEVYLQHIPVRQIAPNTYQTTLPDGGKMYYKYDGGVLKKVTSTSAVFGTVHFIAQTSTGHQK